MKLYIAKRHWFGNEGTLKQLENSVTELGQAFELAKTRGVDFGLLISTPGSWLEVNPEFKERARDAVEKIRKAGMNVNYNLQNESAGEKFYRQLFERRSNEKEVIFGLNCLDQWPLHEEKYWEPVMDLANNLSRDNKFYANGSRNIPATLGYNKEASNMRIIHELFHSLTGKGVFKAEIPQWANPAKAYAEFGESTSGFYLVNGNHRLHGEVKKEIDNHPCMISKGGFAVEYFTAMRAGLENSVVTGYVYANPNYYNPIEPQKENEIFLEKKIKSPTSYISRTSVRESLLSSLEESSRLLIYFESRYIELVKKAMTEQLEK